MQKNTIWILPYTLTGHFIKYTCSIAWLRKLLISQSHGSNSCIWASRCDEDDLLKFKPSIRTGKKGDLSDFERGMVVGGRRLVWVFHKLLIYWDFHTQPSLGFTENGLKKRKYPVSSSCVDENVLLMSEVRGEWTDWLKMIERQQ